MSRVIVGAGMVVVGVVLMLAEVFSHHANPAVFVAGVILAGFGVLAALDYEEERDASNGRSAARKPDSR